MLSRQRSMGFVCENLTKAVIRVVLDELALVDNPRGLRNPSAQDEKARLAGFPTTWALSQISSAA